MRVFRGVGRVREYGVRQAERVHQEIVRQRRAAVGPVRVGAQVEHLILRGEESKQIRIVDAVFREPWLEQLVVARPVALQIARRHMCGVKRVFVGRDREHKPRAARFTERLHLRHGLCDLTRLVFGQGRVVLVVVQCFSVVQPAVRAVDHVLGRRGGQQPGLERRVRGHHLLPQRKVVGDVVGHLAEHRGVPAAVLVFERGRGRKVLVGRGLGGRQEQHACRRDDAEQQEGCDKEFVFHGSLLRTGNR